MARYRRKNPLELTSVGADGTIAGKVRALGRSHYETGERFPAFIGLARATGGWYAENPQRMTVDGHRGSQTARSRDPVGLGTVRDGYRLVQNRDAAELGHVIIDEGGAMRHTGAVKVKLAEARMALGIAWKWTEDGQREAEQLLMTPVAEGDIDPFLDALMGSARTGWTQSRTCPQRRQDVHEVIANSPTNEFGWGTAYAVYDGVTEWLDWEWDVRSADPAAGAERRYIRTLDDDDGIKIRAAELLLAA